MKKLILICLICLPCYGMQEENLYFCNSPLLEQVNSKGEWAKGKIDHVELYKIQNNYFVLFVHTQGYNELIPYGSDYNLALKDYTENNQATYKDKPFYKRVKKNWNFVN